MWWCANAPCRFIAPRPMLLFFSLAFRTVGTAVMFDRSDTDESSRIAVSIVFPRSGDSSAFLTFSDARLQEMSFPRVL